MRSSNISYLIFFLVTTICCSPGLGQELGLGIALDPATSAETLTTPETSPQLGVAVMQVNAQQSSVQLRLFESNPAGMKRLATHSILLGELRCFDLDGKEVATNKLADRFQSAIPVFVVSKLPPASDLSFFKSLAKLGTPLIVYQATTKDAAADKLAGEDKGTGENAGNARADTMPAGQAQSSTADSKSAETSTPAVDKTPTFQLTLDFAMDDETELTDIREFSSIEINQQAIPFGEKAKLGKAMIFVQRKTDSIVVHGLPAGTYAVEVKALVKPEQQNAVQATAADKAIDVTEAQTQTLKFK